MDSIKFRLLANGGFVCGDTDTGRTSYAYPGSPFADEAKRSRAWERVVALEMLAGDSVHPIVAGVEPGPRRAEYDERNWARIKARA